MHSAALPMPDGESSAGCATISAPKKLDPQKQVAVIDSVVAVVNDDVITRQELDEHLRMVVRQLQKQGSRC